MDTLTRTGIVIPANDGSDPVTAYRTSLRDIGTRVEAQAALYGQGALAARPAAGKAGRIYRPSDAALSGVIYWDDGSAWSTIGAADLAAWAAPGIETPGLVGAAVSTSSSATVLAGPAAGRRVVKSLTVAGPAGSTLTLALAGVTLARLVFTASSLGSEVPVCLPVLPGESLTVAATGGTVGVLASWGERADTVVTRLGLVAATAAPATLVGAAGADRVVNQLWVANPGSVASVASVTFAGVAILANVPVAAGALLTLDLPRGLPAGQAITVAGASQPVSFMAAGH